MQGRGAAGRILTRKLGPLGLTAGTTDKHTMPPSVLNTMHEYRQCFIFSLKQRTLGLINFSPWYMFNYSAEMLVTGSSYNVSIFQLYTGMRSPGRGGLKHSEVTVLPAFNFPPNAAVWKVLNDMELPWAHCLENVFLITPFIKKPLALYFSKKVLY